jgi:hypothetical protein
MKLKFRCKECKSELTANNVTMDWNNQVLEVERCPSCGPTKEKNPKALGPIQVGRAAGGTHGACDLCVYDGDCPIKNYWPCEGLDTLEPEYSHYFYREELGEGQLVRKTYNIALCGLRGEWDE